jgi:hypothetical protein
MSGRYLNCVKLFGAALILNFSSGFAIAQDVAVDINPQDIAALSAGCSTSAACDLALSTLIAKLMAANPNGTIEKMLASVIAQISADYNAGKVSASVAKEVFAGALKEANAKGLATLSRSISVAANAAGRGDPVNLEAVAEGSASPS